MVTILTLSFFKVLAFTDFLLFECAKVWKFSCRQPTVNGQQLPKLCGQIRSPPIIFNFHNILFIDLTLGLRVLSKAKVFWDEWPNEWEPEVNLKLSQNPSKWSETKLKKNQNKITPLGITLKLNPELINKLSLTGTLPLRKGPCVLLACTAKFFNSLHLFLALTRVGAFAFYRFKYTKAWIFHPYAFMDSVCAFFAFAKPNPSINLVSKSL